MFFKIYTLISLLPRLLIELDTSYPFVFEGRQLFPKNVGEKESWRVVIINLT